MPNFLEIARDPERFVRFVTWLSRGTVAGFLVIMTIIIGYAATR